MATPSRQDLINSQATSEAPNTIQRRTDYDEETNLPVYIGFAHYGAASSADVWTIYKITYNASGLETLKQTATKAVWDNRTSETYA